MVGGTKDKYYPGDHIVSILTVNTVLAAAAAPIRDVAKTSAGFAIFKLVRVAALCWPSSWSQIAEHTGISIATINKFN